MTTTTTTPTKANELVGAALDSDTSHLKAILDRKETQDTLTAQRLVEQEWNAKKVSLASIFFKPINGKEIFLHYDSKNGKLIPLLKSDPKNLEIYKELVLDLFTEESLDKLTVSGRNANPIERANYSVFVAAVKKKVNPTPPTPPTSLSTPLHTPSTIDQLIADFQKKNPDLKIPELFDAPAELTKDQKSLDKIAGENKKQFDKSGLYAKCEEVKGTLSDRHFTQINSVLNESHSWQVLQTRSSLLTNLMKDHPKLREQLGEIYKTYQHELANIKHDKTEALAKQEAASKKLQESLVKAFSSKSTFVKLVFCFAFPLLIPVLFLPEIVQTVTLGLDEIKNSKVNKGFDEQNKNVMEKIKNLAFDLDKRTGRSLSPAPAPAPVLLSGASSATLAAALTGGGVSGGAVTPPTTTPNLNPLLDQKTVPNSGGGYKPKT